MGNRVNLGVNVDHIATLRQARGVDFPDPVDAALIAEKAGANSITMHLYLAVITNLVFSMDSVFLRFPNNNPRIGEPLIQ